MNSKYEGFTTWDFWNLEEKLGQILEDKGYGLINFGLNYNNQNKLVPCFEVDTDVAEDFAEEIRKHGYHVSTKPDKYRPYLTWVFVKNTYPIELLDIADEFQDCKVIT